MGNLSKQWLFYLVGFCCVFLFAANTLQAYDKSAQDWRTIEYENFIFNYSKQHEAQVRHYVQLYHKHYPSYAQFFNWRPKEKIYVDFLDALDTANGFSTFFPRNLNGILLAPFDQLGELTDRQPQSENLVVHELVHLFHLDKAHGLPKGLRSVFGRFLLNFPAQFQTNWMLEGLAVFIETNASKGYGRGGNSWYPSLMRMEHKNHFPSFSQLNFHSNKPPYNSQYMYGYYFFRFLEQTYGIAKLQQWIDNYSNNFIPFRIDRNMRDTFGKPIHAIWQEFMLWLNAYFAADLQRVTQAGSLVQGQALDSVSSINHNDLFWLNNEQLVGYVNIGYDATLRRYFTDAANSPRTEDWLELKTFGARYHYQSQQGLLLAELGYCADDGYLYDLYVYNPQTNQKNRLTHCSRYRRAIWQGEQILAVRMEGGISYLDKLDTQGQLVENILTLPLDRPVFNFALHPTQNTLAIALFDVGLGSNIYQLNLTSKRLIPLIKNRNQNLNPSYDTQGRLHFMSDAGGVFNVYRLADGQFSQLTRADGSITNYALSPDASKLAVMRMRPGGFENALVHTLKPLTSSAIMQDDLVYFVDSESAITATSADVSATNLAPQNQQPYSAWDTLAPTYWFPLLALNSTSNYFGFTTSAADALLLHNYELNLGYYDSEAIQDVAGSLSYVYDQRWLLVAGREIDVVYDDGQDDWRYWTSKNYIAAGVRQPLWDYWYGVAGLYHRNSRVHYPTYSRALGSNSLASIILGYQRIYNQPNLLANSDGFTFRLSAESHDIDQHNDYVGEVYQIGVNAYFPFLNSSIELGMDAGYADISASSFALGGIVDDADQSLFNLRNYALPGYHKQRSLSGDQVARLGLRYVSPSWLVHDGFYAPPIGIGKIALSPFAAVARLGQSTIQNDDMKNTDYQDYASIGLDVRMELVLGYHWRLPLTIGLASGLDDALGTNSAYINFLQQF